MPHYNVQRPDGQWSMFSTVVDDYIKPFTGREEHDAWRKREYGERNFRPIEECNMMDYEEAEETRRFRHGSETD